MMKDNDCSAFPLPHGIETLEGTQGMTLRDYFAAQAMNGFACDPECSFIEGTAGMAKCAYEWADAMLKARKA